MTKGIHLTILLFYVLCKFLFEIPHIEPAQTNVVFIHISGAAEESSASGMKNQFEYNNNVLGASKAVRLGGLIFC